MVSELAKNWRDVGASLQDILGSEEAAASVLPPGKLLRCGLVDYCSAGQLGRPRAILNLRVCPDTPELPGVTYHHVGLADPHDKYRLNTGEVRGWICEALDVLLEAELPVLVHCHSGKDRTGIIVAIVLKLLGLPDEKILEEFLLSKDAPEDSMRESLKTLNETRGGVEGYLRKWKKNVPALVRKFQ